MLKQWVNVLSPVIRKERSWCGRCLWVGSGGCCPWHRTGNFGGSVINSGHPFTHSSPVVNMRRRATPRRGCARSDSPARPANVPLPLSSGLAGVSQDPGAEASASFALADLRARDLPSMPPAFVVRGGTSSTPCPRVEVEVPLSSASVAVPASDSSVCEICLYHSQLEDYSMRARGRMARERDRFRVAARMAEARRRRLETADRQPIVDSISSLRLSVDELSAQCQALCLSLEARQDWGE